LSTIETTSLWEPTVFGRSPLSGNWWAYLVEAPFDMPADIPGLIGSRVALDGRPFAIGGTIPNAPARSVRQGDAIQILVSPL
jgi:hypothetical protein